jgi:hypothetical protein
MPRMPRRPRAPIALLWMVAGALALLLLVSVVTGSS